jgi:hypothetical protein
MSKILAVSKSNRHHFSKKTSDFIKSSKGLGVLVDAYLGVTAQHRSRLKKAPKLPNLRQIHLIHNELITQLQARVFKVALQVWVKIL